MNGNLRPDSAPVAAPSSEPDPSTYDEFPIMITKSSLNQGLRYHAMKLQSRTDGNGQPIIVNPYEESQFVRPLRLHRRYARDKMTEEQLDQASGEDDKEREMMSARRAERQAEREENQKLIAPTGGEPGRPNKKKPQKKVEEGRDESNPARRKRQQMRYEEARPWHLEDFEGKNVWVGAYEEALSERSIMLEVSTDGTFQMVPVEKWYKFTQTNKVNAMDSEEVEKYLAKKHVPGRWAMGTQRAAEEARFEEHQRRIAARRAALDDDEVKRTDEGDFDADRDMLDLDVKDEFQDDDEGMLFQGEDDEDAAQIERRLYLEMRDAGLGGTGVKDDDKDVEGELHKEQLEKLEEKKRQKRIRRQLRKREHQGQYSDSDSDDPYKDSSDSDSEEEREEEQKKKEEEAKKAALSSDKSGASTRGTNTPTGRSEKRDPARITSNKRPGSPDASDLSGNESSRKKIKSINGRPLSAAPPSKSGALSPPKGSGSGSDTDTSRTGRPKLKLKNKSTNATPNGSRAGSPSGTRTPIDFAAPPALDELRAIIPAGGILMKDLIAEIKLKYGRVYAKGPEFGKALRQVGTLVKRPPGDPKGENWILPRAA